MSNLSTNCHLKLIFKNRTTLQQASGQSKEPNTARTIICEACNSPAEYPSGEYEFDTMEYDSNMFNPIS